MSSPKQVAANQSNAQKSTGPRTPEGKARVSLNAFKTGAYAKTDQALHEIMRRRGQDPQQYDQLREELAGAWQPEDVMQGMLVKGIADKTWDKLQLQSAWLRSQSAALQLAALQGERKQLLARRWLPGARAVPEGLRGLWQAKDSSHKFAQINEILDCLQNWFENEECPEEYPSAMRHLYGNCPSQAGERIRELFIELLDGDEAAQEKARQKLPKWIAQEKSDVQQELELYRREWAAREKGGVILVEEQVEARDATLDRQIAEQTRLLLQLKSKRSLWPAAPEADGADAGTAAASAQESPEKAVKSGETDAVGAIVGENSQKSQTKPIEALESMA